LRTVIYADQDCDTQFAIDQPSALFRSYGNPAITEVGLHLNELVAGLFTALNAAPRGRSPSAWRLGSPQQRALAGADAGPDHRTLAPHPGWP